MTDFNAMTDALISCDSAKLTDLVDSALAQNTPTGDILNKDLIAGMDIVGGAPVTHTFADEIGADGFASDAGSASKLAKSFVN